MFGFQAQEFFSVPPSVKEVPDVEFARQGLTAALQPGRGLSLAALDFEFE
jgi:hypothetical protein